MMKKKPLIHTKTHEEGRKERASERASANSTRPVFKHVYYKWKPSTHNQSFFSPNQSHAYNTIYLSVHTTLRTRSAIILQYTIAYDASPFSFVQRIRQISMQSQVRRVRACDALGCVFFRSFYLFLTLLIAVFFFFSGIYLYMKCI